MPDLTLTPGSLNLTVLAGSPFTLNLDWPAGRLLGRTFTATVVTIKGDVTITPALSVVADTMSLDVDGADTTSLYGRAARWRLYDTTDGPVGADPGVIVMGGRFKSTNQLGNPTERVVEIVDRVADVPVHVVGIPGATGTPGPPGTLNVPTYAGGDFAEGDAVFYAGSLWLAAGDLVDQDPVTLDEDQFTQIGPVTLTLTVADVTGTGLVPQDLGAVSQSGGGREKSFTDDPVSGDYQPDITRGNVAVAFVDGDVTVIPPDVDDPDDSYALLIYFVQKSPGDHSYTWDSSITWLTLSGGVPTMQTETGKGDLVSLIKLGAAGWFGIHNTAQLQIQAAYLDWDLIPAPAAPPSGKLRTWADNTTHHLMQIDSDSNVLDLTAGGGAGGGGGGGGGGVITQVPGQFDHQHNVSGSTITATLPVAATAGNLLTAEFNTDMIGGTITPPTGWTEAIKRASSDNIGTAGIWYKVAAGGETTAVFTLSSGSHLLEVTLTEYEGNTATPLDQTAYAELHNTTNTFNVTTGATTVDAELAVCSVLAGGGYSGGGGLGWGPSGFGTKYDFGDGGSGSKPLSAMGAVTASPNFPGNNYAVGVVATFKAA